MPTPPQRDSDGNITSGKNWRDENRITKSGLKDYERRYDDKVRSRKPVSNTAGKGDRLRAVDPELYRLGYEMTFGETPEIRAEAKAQWYALRGKDDDGVQDRK